MVAKSVGKGAKQSTLAANAQRLAGFATGREVFVIFFYTGLAAALQQNGNGIALYQPKLRHHIGTQQYQATFGKGSLQNTGLHFLLHPTGMRGLAQGLKAESTANTGFIIQHGLAAVAVER